MGYGLAPRMGPRRTPGNRKKVLGRSRLYLAKAIDRHQIANLVKDVYGDATAADVHVPTALRRRGRKMSTAIAAKVNECVAKAFNESQPRDEHGRWTVGEDLGRIAGYGAAALKAPRIYNAVTNRLAQPAVYNFKRFAVNRAAFGRPSRVGLGLLAAYGAVRVGGAVGSYVGGKVDSVIGHFAKGTVEQTMHEYKHGRLHSGSKKGPLVQSREQAIAIALNQAGLSK